MANQENGGDMSALLFDRRVLQTPGLNDGAYLAAIEGIMQKSFTSSLYILPTAGVPEAQEVYEQTNQMLKEICKELGEFALKNDDGITCQGEALALKNFIETANAAASTLTEFTAKEEPGEERKDGQAIRSAFVHFPRRSFCTEKDYQMPVERGGCGVVVKEFRGYQWRLVPRRITRWIEPWFSRRRLITRIVWVLEWVPAEYIKTITVHCYGDKKNTKITQRLVVDRGLMTFWRCH